MNERILNSPGKRRVAEILRSTCEVVSVAQAASYADWQSALLGLR